MNIDEKKTQTAIEHEISAAFIASGIGSAALGLVTTLAEISEPFRDSLFWFNRGGPLGGKTSLAVIAFAVSWAILALMLKKHPIKLKTSFGITLVLVLTGLLLTFPPIFTLIAKLVRA